MCTRGTWQLRRLTLSYAKHAGSSKGVREFIDSGLAQFARENPQIEIVAIHKPSRHPSVTGEYVTGYPQTVPLRNADVKRCTDMFQLLRDRSGRRPKSLKHWGMPNGSVQSVQGRWDPDFSANTLFQSRLLTQLGPATRQDALKLAHQRANVLIAAADATATAAAADDSKATTAHNAFDHSSLQAAARAGAELSSGITVGSQFRPRLIRNEERANDNSTTNTSHGGVVNGANGDASRPALATANSHVIVNYKRSIGPALHQYEATMRKQHNIFMKQQRIQSLAFPPPPPAPKASSTPTDTASTPEQQSTQAHASV
jgi:large subunit ribosomal protein L43